MAYPFFTPVANVQNVAISSTATITPEPNGTYYGLRLRYQRTSGTDATQAQIAADITGIRLIVDGVQQWNLTGAQLQMLNAFRNYSNIAVAAGEIPIYFSEPYRVNEQAADGRSWGMNGVSTFTVEVDIAATAVTPVLKAWRLWTPFPSTMGEIRKIRPQVIQVSGTGDLSVTNFVRNDRILAFHCNSTNIANLRVKINEVEQLNTIPLEYHNMIAENGLTPQAGWTHLAFDARNRILEAADPGILQNSGPNAGRLPYVGFLPFEVIFNMSAAANFTVVREVLGPRD